MFRIVPCWRCDTNAAFPKLSVTPENMIEYVYIYSVILPHNFEVGDVSDR